MALLVYYLIGMRYSNIGNYPYVYDRFFYY